MTRRWLRWVPAAIVPAVIAAGTLLGSLPASAGDPLPAKTPAEVLQLLAQHRKQALSGTVEQVSELGFPALPQTMSGSGPSGTGWLELLSGSHTARVYFDGADNARVQVMDRMAERNLIKNGHELWTYNSKDNTASHFRPPTGGADHDAAHKGMMDSLDYKRDYEGMLDGRDGKGMWGSPDRLAGMLLDKIDEHTAVTVGDDVQVAGRAAYDLKIAPRSTVTLFESMAIAVDGETGMPLSVTVKARGQSTPAFRMAYTNLLLEAPDVSIFAFSPPAGATVTEIPDPERKKDDAWQHGKPGDAAPPGEAVRPNDAAGPDDAAPPGEAVRPDRESKDSRRPTISGSGWETVLGFPAGSAAALFGGTADQALPGPAAPDQDLRGRTDPRGTDVSAEAPLEQALTPVPGGRLLSTSLVNMLVLDDGRIFIGSVPLERLQAAAASR
ncbi:hypothetical protein [Arthrobacter sp. PAMC25284]|uniref:LolA family protein n=1 Tax=Arthrobacter sp. PAMC25284 TaxID=2861279 RepID=UPI001C62C6AA|nr:hypothetical protein [Arthrobacter sp. PAMC25284]QYF88679.1 hypothetical protein KY499_10520 [Arthrobacter sp. PAMC25284]